MKNKSILSAWVLTAFVLGSAGAGWACDAAGPNKHIGIITAINTPDKTFAMRDAQTQHILTFEATPEILKDLNLKDRVMVSYKEEKGKLIAVEVQS